MAKQKKITLKKAKAKAWKSFSDYIRQRDNWTCFTCGRKGTGKGMHAGHAYPKKMGGVLLRFDEMNCHAQCYLCNRHLDGMGLVYSIKLREKYGEHADKTILKLLPYSKEFKPNLAWYIAINELYQTKMDASYTK